MKLLLSTTVFSFLFVLAFSDMIKDEEWVKNYFTELKKTYDKKVAPMGENGPGTPVKVVCTMYILDISEVDDSSMDYTAQFYFRQSWNDSRLSYSDRKENIILRDASDIWTPDLFFIGSREGRLEQIVHPNKMVRIMSSGETFYSIRVTVKFSCPMDLRYFPHDVQKCSMRAESYAHTQKDIDVVWGKGFMPIGANKQITLHNYDLYTFEHSERSENFTTGVYKTLVVSLTFERKFGFFAIKLYVPFIILVIVSFLSFWITPEDRGMRLSLLLIILYLMTSIASEISNHIPAAPYTKGTDVWIGFCVSLVFGIFLEFIAVAMIASRLDKDVSESKGEILMNMEIESKEQTMKSDTPKSHLCKFIHMFDARNGGKCKRNAYAYRIDRISRIVFPIIFCLFNVVYWSVYCCKSLE